MSEKQAAKYLIPAPAPVTPVTISPAPAPVARARRRKRKPEEEELRRQAEEEVESSIKVGEYRVTPGPLVQPDKKTVAFTETTGPRLFDAEKVSFRAQRRPISKRGSVQITPRMPRLR